MRRADDTAQLDEDQAAVAASGVKALIDVGRPFLDYVISVLADVGVDEVCLVIGPEHEVLREYAARVSGGRVTVTTAVQAEPLRSEEHTSELQSRGHLVCRLLL